MGTIKVTAPAKVNLHLEVLGLRPDGFHELAMVMQSIALADRLLFRIPQMANVISPATTSSSVLKRTI